MPPEFRDPAMQAGLLFQSDIRAALLAWYRVHEALPAHLHQLQEAELLPFAPHNTDGSPMAVSGQQPQPGDPAGWYLQMEPAACHYTYFNGTERRATVATTVQDLEQEMNRLCAAEAYVGQGMPASLARLEASDDPVLAMLKCRMEQLSTRCRQYVQLTGTLPESRKAMELALASGWPANNGTPADLLAARSNRQGAVALRVDAAAGYWELEFIEQGYQSTGWRYSYTLNGAGQPQEAVSILRPDDVPQAERSFFIWVMDSPDSV